MSDRLIARTPYLLAALAFGALIVGCSATNVHRLTEEKYPRKGKDSEVKLYINAVSEKHVPIALVNSFAAGEDTPEIRRLQLQDIQKRSRKLGADAVMNVRSLKNKGRGMVPDDDVPFSAVKPGKYTQYFLRGTAIVYVTEDAETTPTMILDDPEIPGVDGMSDTVNEGEIPELETVVETEESTP
jgi:hypothetical protein